MDRARRKEFLNIPNYITFGRLISVPVLVVLMMFRKDGGGFYVLSPAYSFAATMVFVVATLSDLVDGYYARKYKITGTFGKFFDPLADKLLFLSAMIMMIPLGRIPDWLVVIFLVRETVITALRGVAIDSHIVIAASKWGKYKSVFVSTACIGLLLHYPFFDIHWRLIGWVFMVPALIFAVGSGIHYTVGFIKAIARQPANDIGQIHRL